MSTKTKLKVGSILFAVIVATLLVTVFIKTAMAVTLIAKVCGIVSLIVAGIYFFIRWRR